MSNNSEITAINHYAAGEAAEYETHNYSDKSIEICEVTERGNKSVLIPYNVFCEILKDQIVNGTNTDIYLMFKEAMK